MKIFGKLLNKYLDTHHKQMQTICDNQELISKRLSEIDSVLPKNKASDGIWAYDNIASCLSMRDMMDTAIKKDYFTKEFINEDATNTETLYVINGDKMTPHLFRKGNESKEVKSINGKNYLWI